VLVPNSDILISISEVLETTVLGVGFHIFECLFVRIAAYAIKVKVQERVSNHRENRYNEYKLKQTGKRW